MSVYIKLSTLEYPRHIGDIEVDTDKNYAHVEWVDMPEFDVTTQRCGEGAPVEVDGIWYITWIVRDATQEEIENSDIELQIGQLHQQLAEL